MNLDGLVRRHVALAAERIAVALYDQGRRRQAAQVLDAEPLGPAHRIERIATLAYRLVLVGKSQLPENILGKPRAGVEAGRGVELLQPVCAADATRSGKPPL